ncbi:MAG: WG repeat-containing protein [Saprospiraceae bacterium]|nr:WG repeat-containing protein [Saprospiraceae bacterium]
MTQMRTYPIIKIVVLIAIICLTNAVSAQRDSPLFPIEQKGKWGFINQQGKVIIKPIFENVGEFSNGLAPARLKGSYGYIDQKGSYQIKPVFDHGANFMEGLAFVNMNGKKFLIDTTGTILFQHNYQDIICADEPCTMKRFIATTQRGDQGIIDFRGKIILDTIYRQVLPYSEGYAVVITRRYHNFRNDRSASENELTGVIDTLANFIIPLGKYKEIGPFVDGIAKVVISSRPYNHVGIIDTNGRLITSFTSLRYSIDHRNANFSEGILPVKVFERDSVVFKFYDEEGLHIGVLDKEGKIIAGDTIVKKNFMIVESFPPNPNPFYEGNYALLDDKGKINSLNKNFYYIGPFSQNRAFTRGNLHYGPSYIIDKKGKVVNNKSFQNLYGEGFKNGIAIAEVREGIVPIDTLGNFIYPPKDIDDGNCILKDSCIFFGSNIDEENTDKYQWGYWDLKTNTFIKAKFDNILSPRGFQNGLLYVMEDNIKGYVNRIGKYVWREKKHDRNHIQKLNSEYMLRGGFSAASPYKAELAGFGGWATSNNLSQKVKKDKKLKPNQFYVEIRENEKETYANQYKGFAFYIINTTPDTIAFEAQDSWLYLTIEAQDDKGNWKPIQYIPGSWCGNSYHQVFLAKNEYWKFTMPKFSGAQKTKLRLALQYRDPQTNQIQYIYSNTVKGKINPAQFWQKQEYTPTNIMDPYDE